MCTLISFYKATPLTTTYAKKWTLLDTPEAPPAPFQLCFPPKWSIDLTFIIVSSLHFCIILSPNDHLQVFKFILFQVLISWLKSMYSLSIYFFLQFFFCWRIQHIWLIEFSRLFFLLKFTYKIEYNWHIFKVYKIVI
jgi:hypothetical protein